MPKQVGPKLSFSRNRCWAKIKVYQNKSWVKNKSWAKTKVEPKQKIGENNLQKTAAMTAKIRAVAKAEMAAAMISA